MRWYWECLDCAACGRKGHKDAKDAKEYAKQHIMDKHNSDADVIVYQAKFCGADKKYYLTKIHWN